MCERPGCVNAGEHRAPRSRAALGDYYWFCLDHVREYNLAWNYYAGMNEHEIENEIRSDSTWQRPTWPLGRWGSRNRDDRAFYDPFDVFSGREGEKPGRRSGADEVRRRALSPEDKAMEVFDLSPPLSRDAIKTRYKALVKMHHPDIHGGDKAAEERLKTINQAYAVLKAAYPT